MNSPYLTSPTVVLPLPRPRFWARGDKMARMSKKTNATQKQERTTIMRVPMTVEEKKRLAADSINPELNKETGQGHYIRHVLLSPLDPSTALPDFSTPFEPVERPVRASVRLSPEELKAIGEQAKELGTDPWRYARWRLLGVVE